MFPGQPLNTVANVLLLKAQAEHADDEAKQYAFVHYKAFTAVADRFGLQLMRERRLDSEAWRDKAQLAHWKERAAYWKAELERDSDEVVSGGGVIAEICFV